MKITLEDREYDLIANGSLMLEYQEKFGETLVMALYKMSSEKDVLTCAKLIYCSAHVKEGFREWLESFKSPTFTLGVMNSVLNYISTGIEPTVQPKSKGNVEQNNLKKKKI